jgi:predicted kinase
VGTLIIITGSPAAGKSTFARSLSQYLSVPCLCKDEIKISLYEYLEFSNQAESRQLSKATVNAMLSVSESLMNVGITFIIEANFRQDEGIKIQALLNKHSYQSLTFAFGGDPKVLGKRFIGRDRTEERHPANRTFDVVQELDKYEALFKQYDDFDVGGKRICVDSTDFGKINFKALMEEAKNLVISPRA